MNTRARLRLLAVTKFVGENGEAASFMTDLIDTLAYNIALWRVAQKEDGTNILQLAKEQLEEIAEAHEKEMRRLLDEAKAKRQANPEGSPHSPVGGGEG